MNIARLRPLRELLAETRMTVLGDIDILSAVVLTLLILVLLRSGSEDLRGRALPAQVWNTTHGISAVATAYIDGVG